MFFFDLYLSLKKSLDFQQSQIDKNFMFHRCMHPEI